MKQLLKHQSEALKSGDITEAIRLSLIISKQDQELNGDNSFDVICTENFNNKVLTLK